MRLTTRLYGMFFNIVIILCRYVSSYILDCSYSIHTHIKFNKLLLYRIALSNSNGKGSESWWNIRWDFWYNTLYILNNYMRTKVEIRLGHLGYLDHILSGSSGSNPLYKISGSDPDSALHHVCQWWYMALIKVMNFKCLMVMMKVYILKTSHSWLLY